MERQFIFHGPVSVPHACINLSVVIPDDVIPDDDDANYNINCWNCYATQC